MKTISVLVRPDGLIVLTRGFERCVLNADRTWNTGSVALYIAWTGKAPVLSARDLVVGLCPDVGCIPVARRLS